MWQWQWQWQCTPWGGWARAHWQAALAFPLPH